MSSDFLTSTIPYLAVIGISNVLVLYAAYLSFSVWRGLSVPIYRSRAIWTGVLAVLLGLTSITSGNVNALFPAPYSLVGIVAVYGILYPLAIFVLFFWIDRTMAMIIRLDYLRRDLLGWRRFRFVYWGFAAGSFVFYLLGNPILLPNPTPTDVFVFGGVLSLTYAVPWGYASLALVVGRRRTRDATFRLHLKWFGLCIASIVFAGLTYSLIPDPFIGNLPFVLIAFCLYKMARFLVPAQRLNLNESDAGSNVGRRGPAWAGLICLT
jgi:hypothetical protein